MKRLAFKSIAVTAALIVASVPQTSEACCLFNWLFGHGCARPCYRPVCAPVCAPACNPCGNPCGAPACGSCGGGAGFGAPTYGNFGPSPSPCGPGGCGVSWNGNGQPTTHLTPLRPQAQQPTTNFVAPRTYAPQRPVVTDGPVATAPRQMVRVAPRRVQQASFQTVRQTTRGKATADAVNLKWAPVPAGKSVVR